MPRKKSIPKPELLQRSPDVPEKEVAAVSPSPPSAENKSEIENPAPEIKNMEVHHHPEVENKTFKEYLLEGLMIFIAVMMGFIAENVREDYTEHKKADAYAITMAADVASDTVQLKDYMAYYNFARMNTDTLMKLISSTADIKSIPTGKLYLYGLWGGSRNFFIPNDATFQQMKSTGSLQFFEKNVLREASTYDQKCRKMELYDETDNEIYVEVRKLRSQIFEFQYNTKANDLWAQITPAPAYKYTNKQAAYAKIDSFIKTKPPLLTYDKLIMNQYVELVRSRYLYRKIDNADTALVHAKKLLTDIKKEYHIE